jgi:protein tyrosine phosphatase
MAQPQMNSGRPDLDSPLDPDKLKAILSPEKREELQHEYNDIPSFMPSLSDMPPGTKPKNRYVNVLPNARTRVPLSKVPDDDASDFINANFVSGGVNGRDANKYIACQGPLPNTMFDYWRMIWEQGVECIVMTTGLTEGGRKKCHRYWPEDAAEPYEFGWCKITVVDAVNFGDWITTTLTLTNTQDNTSRTIKHFWYTGWPDHGVPATAAPVIRFLRAVKKDTLTTKTPVLVHCSAGIGRTGTFMAIDIGMQMMQCEWRVCDIKGTVKAMRRERGGSVQTAVQYRFIHQALLEYVTPGIGDHSMFGDATAREVVLTKSAKYKYFGFTCRGSKPVFFNVVDAGGLAESNGVRTGDHILKVNGVDASRMTHKQVVEQIIKAGDSLSLTVISKMDY